jgi:hypothetical protein
MPSWINVAIPEKYPILARNWYCEVGFSNLFRDIGGVPTRSLAFRQPAPGESQPGAHRVSANSLRSAPMIASSVEAVAQEGRQPPCQLIRTDLFFDERIVELHIWYESAA